MKVMWMQLSDPGLFQVLHKSQGWPIHLALLSHLQPQLEFPGAGSGRSAQWDTLAALWGETAAVPSVPPSSWRGEN